MGDICINIIYYQPGSGVSNYSWVDVIKATSTVHTRPTRLFLGWQ
ncbi:MAG: hypothetical protein HW384_102 [Dehalococcoidia bacterium]|nr:hypothetical protein [Dehalococcoidia bacterium]